MKYYLTPKNSFKKVHTFPKWCYLVERTLQSKVTFFVFFLLAGLFVKAQTADPSNFYHHFKTSSAAEAAVEEYAGKLDSCHMFGMVAAKMGASKADMNVFTNYYEDTIYNDRAEYVAELLSTINTDNDIKEYANKLIIKYVALYQQLKNIEREFPDTYAEYINPKRNRKPAATCNPTCSDIGFESGSLTGWNAYYAGNNSTTTKMTYTAVVGGAAGAVTQAANDIVNCKYHTKPTYQVKVMSGAGTDAIAGGIIPVVAPGGGSYSCRLGDTSVGGSRVAIIDQQFTVTAGNTALNYMYAPVVDMPAYNAPHTWGQQPHFIVTITDVATGDTLQCGTYLVTSSTTGTDYTAVYYTVPAYNWQDTIYVAPWKSVFVSLQNYIGKCIDIQAIVSDCYPSAIGPHFCYVYFDATCGPFSIIASTPSVCGGNITLTAPTGGSAYSWVGPGIVGSSTGSSITANATGTYTVTVTSADGCTDTLQKPVTITPTMSVTATSTNGTCSGAGGTGTATPTGGTPPYTYAWSNGNTNAKDTGLAAGNYTCTVSAAGCVQTVTVTVTKPTPMTTTVASTTTPCGVSSGTASVTVNGGSPAYTYAWNNGQTTSSMSALAAGAYSVTVTDANGCTTTANVSVSSTNGPRDSIVTSTNVLCFGGDNGSATVGVTGGTSPYIYSWNTTPAQTSSAATTLSAGSYTVTVTDNTGCVTSANVTITQPPPIRDSIVNSVNELCFGGNNGSATVGAKGGTPTYTYSWNTAPVETTVTATGLIAGNYTVDVTDANGCKDSTKVTITQPPAVTIKTTTFPATCSYLCNGQAIVVPSGGTNPYTYNWSNGGTVASISNLCINTNYSVTVTDGHGCKADTNITITDPTPIILTTDSTPSVCNKADGNASVTATGGTPGYTYAWNNGQTTTTAVNLAAGTYTVIVSDANKCKDTTKVIVLNQGGDSVKITGITNELCNGGNNGSATANAMGGVAPYTYAWAASGGTSATASNLVAGTYTVTIADANGCTAKTTATITQPTPVIVTVPPQTICIGQSATLTATAGGGTSPYTYTWTPGGSTGQTLTVSPTTTTPYSVTATDANGCTTNTTVTVTVRPPLSVVAGPPKSICPGGSATITATATGGDGTYYYSWNPSGATSASITVTPNSTTTYTVIVSDGCGTPVAKDSVPITVYPLPVVNLVADTLQGCSPLCVNFTNLASVTGGTIATYAWTFGDGSTSTSTNPQHCYNTAGVYSVGLSVTSNNGCPGSTTINNYISVWSHPIANFSLSPQPTDINSPTIYFADHSTDAYGIANWFWQFGDGTDSIGVVKDPQHTYADTGWYCVNLQVTNIHGCIDNTTQCLYIAPFFVIYVPNAFTPNNDGKNDLFTAKGVGILEYNMWIFDRWGQQLYHTTDIYGGWNGVVQNSPSGQQEQEDTYVWLIEVTDVFHKNHRYVGKVSLIR